MSFARLPSIRREARLLGAAMTRSLRIGVRDATLVAVVKRRDETPGRDATAQGGYVPIEQFPSHLARE